jgi:hypothetical protein
MSDKLRQFENAPLSILVTLSGIVTLVTELEAKAEGPMPVTGSPP